MTQEQYGAALGQLAVTVVMTWLTHTLLALFLAAWLAVVGGVICFFVAALRFRRYRKETGLAPEREREADTLLRRGWLGVLGCAAVFFCYLPMAWATTYYYDAISQGLVAYSPTWWIVWSLTMLWYASIPLGIAGTVAAWLSGIRLRRLVKDDPSSGTVVAANPLLGEGD